MREGVAASVRCPRDLRSRRERLGLLLLLLASIHACAEHPSKQGRYVIISDNTMGSGRLADPEDGFALLTAMLNEDARPSAILSTFGNTQEGIAYDSILKVRTATGSDVRVLHGATAPQDRASERSIEGVDYLVTEAANRPGALDVVSIGSLTTLAVALERDSAFAENVGKIVIMGGAVFVPGNVPLGFKSEFNLAFDAMSVQIVFEKLHGKITLVPLDATNGVVFDSNDMERLRAGTKPLHKFILESVSRWYELNVPLSGGFFLFDVAALVVYLVPEVVTREEIVKMRVEASGATEVDENGWPVSVVLGVDAAHVKERIFRTLGL